VHGLFAPSESSSSSLFLSWLSHHHENFAQTFLSL
jgi:hypothetical protein